MGAEGLPAALCHAGSLANAVASPDDKGEKFQQCFSPNTFRPRIAGLRSAFRESISSASTQEPAPSPSFGGTFRSGLLEAFVGVESPCVSHHERAARLGDPSQVVQ